MYEIGTEDKFSIDYHVCELAARMNMAPGTLHLALVSWRRAFNGIDVDAIRAEIMEGCKSGDICDVKERLCFCE